MPEKRRQSIVEVNKVAMMKILSSSPLSWSSPSSRSYLLRGWLVWTRTRKRLRCKWLGKHPPGAFAIIAHILLVLFIAHIICLFEFRILLALCIAHILLVRLFLFCLCPSSFSFPGLVVTYKWKYKEVFISAAAVEGASPASWWLRRAWKTTFLDSPDNAIRFFSKTSFWDVFSVFAVLLLIFMTSQQ